MGWELKGKPSIVKATAKLAKEYMEMEAAHVDRPLSERRLQVYRKIRDMGLFRPVTWARAWCEETQQFYRVNGKHTSTLFSDGQKLENIYINLEDYDCDTLEDIAKLYATFDSGVAARNTTDINKSFAATIPELSHLPARFINLVVSALNFSPAHGDGGGSQNKIPAERAEVLFDHIPEIEWLEKMLQENTSKSAHLWRVPVVAAMISTYRKSQKAATEFWEAVRDETGAKPDLPDRKLAKYLTTSYSRAASRVNVPLRFKVMPREYYVKCVHGWNAWRMGESTNLQYFAAAKVPTVK